MTLFAWNVILAWFGMAALAVLLFWALIGAGAGNGRFDSA